MVNESRQSARSPQPEGQAREREINRTYHTLGLTKLSDRQRFQALAELGRNDSDRHALGAYSTSAQNTAA